MDTSHHSRRRRLCPFDHSVRVSILPFSTLPSSMLTNSNRVTNYSPQFSLASNGVPIATAKATTALATTHVTSLATTYVASSAASPAFTLAATSAPAGKPPGAPSLAVVMDSKPAYSAPGNSTSTVMPTGMTSGTISGMPSGTGAAPIQKLTGGAERVGRMGWVYSFGAVVVGAIMMRFAF
jgi:hypothetical protein